MKTSWAASSRSSIGMPRALMNRWTDGEYRSYSVRQAFVSPRRHRSTSSSSAIGADDKDELTVGRFMSYAALEGQAASFRHQNEKPASTPILPQTRSVPKATISGEDTKS